MEKIFAEIKAERIAGANQYGGDENDDEHGLLVWVALITKQIGMSLHENRKTLHPTQVTKLVRSRFIKAAALCVAAIEAIDRR